MEYKHDGQTVFLPCKKGQLYRRLWTLRVGQRTTTSAQIYSNFARENKDFRGDWCGHICFFHRNLQNDTKIILSEFELIQMQIQSITSFLWFWHPLLDLAASSAGGPQRMKMFRDFKVLFQ